MVFEDVVSGMVWKRADTSRNTCHETFNQGAMAHLATILRQLQQADGVDAEAPDEAEGDLQRRVAAAIVDHYHLVREVRPLLCTS